jgi:lambda family phage tail tape measure protein
MAKEIRLIVTVDTSGSDRGLKKVEDGLDRLEQKSSQTSSALKNAFLGIIGLETIDQFIKMEGALTGLQNKLQVVAGSQAAANEAFGQITGIADRTRSSLADVGDLYSKIALAGDKLGLSQAQVAQTTETFTKALKLTGAGAAQSSAAILQFGQALASGKMQGDEFRSLMENAPGFMGKLSSALGVSQGELRKLATEGALTADVVIAATQEMAASVEDDFAKTTPTIADAFTVLKNNIMLMFDEINKGSGVFEYVRKLVTLLAENIGVAFKFIGAMIAFALGAKAVALVLNFVKALQVLRAATKAQTMAQAAMLALGGPAGLAALAAGAIAATAAYVMLDKAIPDSIALPEAPKPVDLGEAPSAKELLEAAKKKAQADKDAAKAAKDSAREAESAAKKAAREQAREAEARKRTAERNLQGIKENIAQLKVETTAMGEKLALDLRLVGTAEDYIEQQQKIFDINKARDKTIADIQAKELSTAPAENLRLQAEEIAKVNAEYDKQIKSLDTLIAIRIKEAQTTGGRDVARIGRDGAAAVDAINTELGARQFLFDYQKRAAIETNRINAKAAEDEAVLNETRATMDKKLYDQLLLNIQNRKAADLKALADVTEAERKKNDTLLSFSEGLAEAQRQAQKDVLDQAKYAQELFNTAMNGFTDAILNFTKTGKLSFKDLFASLMAEIVKMQAKRLFLQLFGGGGVFGNLLGIPAPVPGARAVGGPVMAGAPYVVGERGPELFVPSGPGTVVANGRFGGGGMTQVNYNINAVDALSFKQLVARDPEFIYSVTQAGARRLPR